MIKTDGVFLNNSRDIIKQDFTMLDLKLRMRYNIMCILLIRIVHF